MSLEQVPQGRRRPTVAYYRRNGVEVTDVYLTVGDERYEISALAHPRRARGALHPGVTVGLVIAVAEAAFIAPFVTVTHTPIALFGALVALSIPCLVGIFCARRWPALFELVVDYRGREMVVYANRNETEFGQVARAVQRALEAVER
jgi:Family of unknown function (DUF6232)